MKVTFTSVRGQPVPKQVFNESDTDNDDDHCSEAKMNKKEAVWR